MKKRRGPVSEQQQTNDNGQDQPRRSAIVEPKPTMLANLSDHDGSEAEHRRRGDLADELFREIVRRAAVRDRRPKVDG